MVSVQEEAALFLHNRVVRMTMTALRCEGWGNEACINEWKMKQKTAFL